MTNRFNCCTFEGYGRRNYFDYTLMPKPENIIPPVKGERRNPNGRPLGSKNRKTLLKKWLELSADVLAPISNDQFNGTVEDAVYIALIKKALDGDVNAIKEISDTMYGKLKDSMEVSGDLNITGFEIEVIK